VLAQFVAVSNPEITTLRISAETLAQLSEMLIEVVANNGSVSFMHPLSRADAETFWTDALAAQSRNERVVLGAWEGDLLVGTVTLLLDFPPNQPHRAEIAKLMTRQGHRGHGVATLLMEAAETIAVEMGRTLLVLDTAVDGGAGSMYHRLGFTLTGEIPDYAFKPHGGLTGTLIFWKRIGPVKRLDLS
jgi:ribosomal protein S18 acetylase RimI-like enzyme